MFWGGLTSPNIFWIVIDFLEVAGHLFKIRGGQTTPKTFFKSSQFTLHCGWLATADFNIYIFYFYYYYYLFYFIYHHHLIHFKLPISFPPPIPNTLLHPTEKKSIPSLTTTNIYIYIFLKTLHHLSL
jgi:hypothetical protein